MGFRGTHVRLHPSGHRLGAEHEVGNFLVHKLDKPGIYLFRVGHGECLDIDLVLNAGNHHLVLCRVGYLVSQPLAVGVALADRLSVDNRLSVSMGKVHIVGHREFLGQYQRGRGGKKSQVAGVYQYITTVICRVM